LTRELKGNNSETGKYLKKSARLNKGNTTEAEEKGQLETKVGIDVIKRNK